MQPHTDIQKVLEAICGRTTSQKAALPAGPFS